MDQSFSLALDPNTSFLSSNPQSWGGQSNVSMEPQLMGKELEHDQCVCVYGQLHVLQRPPFVSGLGYAGNVDVPHTALQHVM